MSNVSRSRNKAGEIVWIAREKGKVIARSDSEQNLDRLLEDRAAANRIPLEMEGGDSETEEGDSEDGSETEGSSSRVRPRKSKK